jgi:hypothetical protein
MKSIVLTMVGAVFVIAAHGANFEKRDGNWWRGQPKTIKAGYLLGLLDGGALIETRGTVSQLEDGLDAFYEDFRNRAILVQRAARIVAMSINGESAEKVQSATELAQ